jgi:hypothetical protein
VHFAELGSYVAVTVGPCFGYRDNHSATFGSARKIAFAFASVSREDCIEANGVGTVAAVLPDVC